mgnify:CR=1 FL=1
MALSIIACFSLTAMADTTLTSVQSSTEQSAAIERLGGLAIMQGDPNGDFRANDSLTRAEFAKIAVITGGFKAEAVALASEKAAFRDVKANAWYIGYINAAFKEGLIKGYEDNTFRPAQTISNQEVATVILRLLGYTDLTGTWPANYLNLVKEQGLLTDSGAGKAKAVRGEVAVLVSKALDKNIVLLNTSTQKYEVQKAGDGNALTLLMQMKAAETAAAGTYYGVVLDYTLNGKAVTALKVFNQEGKTITYPVASGVYADMSAETDIKAGTAYVGCRAVEKGSFIKYGLNENGTIVKDYSANYTKDNDNKGDTSASNKTISFNGKRYTLTSDAHIFNLTMKNNELKVELISLSKALASNILYGESFKLKDNVDYIPALAAILPNENATMVLDNLVLANYALGQGTSYGFVEETGFKDSEGNNLVSFYGDAISYKIAKGSSAGIAKGKLYDCYKSGDGGLKLLELQRDDFKALDGAATKQFCKVTLESGGLLNVENITGSAVTAQYEITNKTVFYNYSWSNPNDDPEYTDGVEAGDKIYLLTNTEKEALLIIVDKNL